MTDSRARALHSTPDSRASVSYADSSGRPGRARALDRAAPSHETEGAHLRASPTRFDMASSLCMRGSRGLGSLHHWRAGTPLAAPAGAFKFKRIMGRPQLASGAQAAPAVWRRQTVLRPASCRSVWTFAVSLSELERPGSSPIQPSRNPCRLASRHECSC